MWVSTRIWIWSGLSSGALRVIYQNFMVVTGFLRQTESFVFDLVKDPSWCKSHLQEGDVNIFTGVFPCAIKQQKLVLSFDLVLTIIIF